MIIYVRYLPEFDNYGIEKSATAVEGTPEIRLPSTICKKLVPNIEPKAKIGFLFGQDKSSDGTEFYTIDKSYLTSLLNAGADLRFLDYEHVYKQTAACDGMVLPGGVFNSPHEFYIKNTGTPLSKRAHAYIQAVMAAEAKQKPLLGICAGAQMIGGMHGYKMYSSICKETNSGVMHKSKEHKAHEIYVKEDSPLYKIMQLKNPIIWVNSRHSEAMIEEESQKYYKQSDLEIYAVSNKDNIPEAWGNEEKGILCIQWHPENLAVEGNASMQHIYDWIVEKAARSEQKKSKILMPLILTKTKDNR